MPIELNALDDHAQSIWARVVTTAQAAGETFADAKAIAERGLTNAGLAPGAKTKASPFATRTSDGLRISLPVVAVTKSRTQGKRRVFGFGSVAVDADGVLVIDHQDDIIEPAELEEGVYDFTKNARKADIQHDRHPIGDLIESAYLDPRKRVAMDGDGQGRVGWWAGFEVPDEVAARVERGELSEFSIDVMAQRVTGLDGSQLAAKSKARERISKGEIGRLRNLQIRLLSLVDAGAGKGVSIELVKARESEKTVTIEQIKAAIAALSSADKKALMDAIDPEDKEPPVAPGADTPAAKALQEALKARDLEIEKARAAAAEASAQVELLKAKDAEREEIAKARAAGFDALSGLTIEEHAKALIAVRKALPEVAAKLEPAMKSWAASIKNGPLFKQHGAGHEGGDADGKSFDDLYLAVKSADPKKAPTEILAEIKAKYPRQYAEKYAR